MSEIHVLPGPHGHIFLGESHDKSERRTWAVIWLCGAMMVFEIVGGLLFGSIALVADGLHMSTHAGALLLAALAYTYARRHADDERYTFGTGKLGDLAGFTSAIILAMIAILIGYESIVRLFAPVAIRFSEAISIACLGLVVNVASAWLLSGSDHHQGHSHGHGHGGHDDHHGHDEAHRVVTADGALLLSVFEENHPPVFRVAGHAASAGGITIETIRPDGSHQSFTMTDRGGYLESLEEIPEPHEFTARLSIGGKDYPVSFEEHDHGHDAHGAAHRDNNMRAAIVHVMADAAVSVLVIVGLLLARTFGWLWMDPLAGIVGDMNPDTGMTARVRRIVEAQGDQLTDLHVWRLGPGHLGAIVSVATESDRAAGFYREKLAAFSSISHLTVEVARAA